MHAYQGVGEEDFRKLGGVILAYFTRALGEAFTPAMAAAWGRLMEVVCAMVASNGEGDPVYQTTVNGPARKGEVGKGKGEVK